LTYGSEDRCLLVFQLREGKKQASIIRLPAKSTALYG